MRLYEPTLAFIALTFLAGAALANPLGHYTVTPIQNPPDAYIEITGRNDLGELVGWRSPGDDGVQYGFTWHDGEYVYLNGLFSPAATVVEPASINNHSQIVGQYIDSATGTYQGFRVEDGVVQAIAGPPDARHVFVNWIDDRGLIHGASYDADGNYSEWLLENGNYTLLDLSFAIGGHNARGVFSGTQFIQGVGPHAAIQKDGVVTLIGPVNSIGYGINDRGQVVGLTDSFGAHLAFIWDRGQLKSLPKLHEDQRYSRATAITNYGVISGSTTILGPTGTVSIPTFWYKNQVADVHTLIHPDDPLRPFLTLWSASPDQRGVVLARGVDSRVDGPMYFWLTPMP